MTNLNDPIGGKTKMKQTSRTENVYFPVKTNTHKEKLK